MTKLYTAAISGDMLVALIPGHADRDTVLAEIAAEEDRASVEFGEATVYEHVRLIRRDDYDAGEEPESLWSMGRNSAVDEHGEHFDAIAETAETGSYVVRSA